MMGSVNVTPVEPAMRRMLLKDAKSRCLPPYGPSMSARCVVSDAGGFVEPLWREARLALAWMRDVKP